MPDPAKKEARDGAGGARILCWALACFGAILHFRFLLHAGPLWRDEAEHLGRALLSWPELARSMGYSPVPALPTVALKLWAGLWGESDLALRGLGLLLGLANIAAVCWAGWAASGRLPALALALWVAAPASVAEAAGIKGYGWGSLFIALTCGLLWRERPAKRTALAAAAAAFASVQCVYSNALTVGLLAAARLASRGRGDARVPLAAGLAAAVSAAPYALIMSRFAQWKTGLGELFGWDAVGHVLLAALAPGGTAWAALGGLLLLAALIAARGAARWALASAVLALGAQAVFVKASAFAPYERYFLALLPPLALAAGWALEERPWAKALPLAVLLLGAPQAWRQAGTRQTNVDLAAAALESASPRDVVVLGRWYYYSSFARYYQGPAPWVAVPFLEPRPYYEKFLFQEWAQGPDPMEPTIAAVREAWRKGGKVWVVGHPPVAPPGLAARRPAEPDLKAHTLYWEARLFSTLSSRGPGREVRLPDAGPVNRLETLRLAVWE